MADFSGSSGFLSDAAASGYYDSSSSAGAGPQPDAGATGDLAALLGGTYGDMSGGPGPGQAGLGTDIGSGLGALVGDFFGGPLGGALGSAGGAALASYMSSPGGMKRRGTHLNKSTYYTKSGRVAKGSKQVTNRRRNAGNAKAVRRALGRLAMFDNLARKVEGEMARVARRHHRAAPRRAPSHRGHRPGCRCFACRR